MWSLFLRFLDKKLKVEIVSLILMLNKQKISSFTERNVSDSFFGTYNMTQAVMGLSYS